LHEELFEKVRCFAADNSLTVAYPNTPFDPTTAPYIEPFILFTATAFAGMNIEQQRGMLQIDVNYRDGGGIVVPMSMIDWMVAAFPRNLRIPLPISGNCIEFMRTGYASPPLVDGGWVKIPVNFEFRITF
jgi:hypothetical protein